MPSSDETSRYFDAHARELRASQLINKWSMLKNFFVDLPAGALVLECGAGTGLYTIELARLGLNVHAVDLSAASLAQLREQAARAGVVDRIRTSVGDFAEAGKRSEPVDAVTFIKVLHHFPSFEHVNEALTVAWRALKPGGRIVVFEPNGRNPLWGPLFRLRGKKAWHSERNIRLMRPSNFDVALGQLPGANITSGFRYLIPGTFTVRSSTLDRMDRALVKVARLRSAAAFLWYVIEKTATETDIIDVTAADDVIVELDEPRGTHMPNRENYR